MTRKRNENDLVVSASSGAASARRKPAPRARAKQPVDASQAPQREPGAVAESTYAQIAALAYSYWESRGFQGGSAEEDWLRAEQELGLRTSAAAV